MTLDKQTWQTIIADHLKKSAHPLIVILGPTASGKTGFAVDLALWLGNAEIVNADSRQLFSGMDIGTAKVTKEEMKGIPHHLLDVLKPSDAINVAWYKEEAEKTIDGILAGGNIPLLVGGSMLYIASVTDGLSFDEKVRTELRSPESQCKYDVLILGLGKDREEVVANINNRTQALFDAGWIDEVQRLLSEGYTANDPGMKACGYREIIDYVEHPGDLPELIDSITAKTRQYGRRQMTWWRGDTRINWL